MALPLERQGHFLMIECRKHAVSEPTTHPGDRRVICFGELLLRLSPPTDELLLQSPALKVHVGGAEANVACSLALLGHPTTMVSTLPDSVLGRACVGELRRYGVDMDVQYASGRMGLYFLTPGAMRRPSDVLYDRAGSAFATAPAASYDWPRLLAHAGWLHLSGITLAVSDASAHAALAAARAASDAGIPVSFDCNIRERLWAQRFSEAPALMREMVAHANVLFGNDRDIALMLGHRFSQDQAIDRFAAAADAAFTEWPRLRRMASTARVHHSADHQEARGLCASRDGLIATDAHELKGIVDRIGTGDAFAAGLLHRLFEGAADRDALAFAMAAFCLKHSVAGDASPFRAGEVEAFASSRGFDVRR